MSTVQPPLRDTQFHLISISKPSLQCLASFVRKNSKQYVWEVSPRAGNDPYWIWFFFTVKLLNWFIQFQNCCNLLWVSHKIKKKRLGSQVQRLFYPSSTSETGKQKLEDLHVVFIDMHKKLQKVLKLIHQFRGFKVKKNLQINRDHFRPQWSLPYTPV